MRTIVARTLKSQVLLDEVVESIKRFRPGSLEINGWTGRGTREIMKYSIVIVDTESLEVEIGEGIPTGGRPKAKHLFVFGRGIQYRHSVLEGGEFVEQSGDIKLAKSMIMLLAKMIVPFEQAVPAEVADIEFVQIR